MRGYGITVCLENLETHEVFKTTPLSIMSKNAVIENIPAGQYEVCMIEIPLGERRFWNDSDELRRFWDIIEICPNTNYYLGDYKATQQGKLSRRKIVLTLESHTIPEKLKKDIKKQGLDPEGFVALIPAEESFVIAEFSELNNKVFVGGAENVSGVRGSVQISRVAPVQIPVP